MPEQLGRYLLHEPLGKGGMSEVFRATLQGPMGFAKDVAIKRVSRELTADRENVRALVNEARIGALLRHRNVVEVFELDQADDAWYVAMELVRGKTLWDLLHRCRSTGAFVPRAVALAITEQVAEGLHYAHNFADDDGRSISLVHRDLKPANVMVSDRGVVKIMDFGIARSSMRFYKTSLGGPLKGTPLYMAPEQLEGVKATTASDVFSLTVMLYEMLTNARLFLAPTTVGVIDRLTRMDLTPFVQPIQERDPELGRLLRRGLHRDPRARLSSAAEFREELARLRKDTPLDLVEFVRYLQLAPIQGLVTADEADEWRWTPPSDVKDGDPGDARDLTTIARDLHHFGVAFFGPILFPDSRERELNAARRSLVPHYGSFDSGTRPVPSGSIPLPGKVDTRAATKVAPAAPQQVATVVGHEVVDPSTLTPRKRPLRLLAGVGCLVLTAVGLALAAGMFIGRPRFAAADLDRHAAAVEAGDWTTAAAVAARAALVPDRDEARLVLATDAALAGRSDEARVLLGDVTTLPDPLRSRALLLLGGLDRADPGGYEDAATAYGQALDCAGGGCEPIIEAARAGLLRACVGMKGGPTAACDRTRVPAWTSDGERSLVRSVVLLDDGHAAAALEALEAGLAPGQDLACPGLVALRRWADEGSGRLDVTRQGALDARGRPMARTAVDCQRFEETKR
jgi:serine/threonine protein kinase